MKKIALKTACVLLAVTTFLCTFTGCKKKKAQEPVETIPAAEEKSGYAGVHSFGMEETNDYLIQDGKCDYVLITRSNLTGPEQTAKEEFVTLFKKATNLRIQTMDDRDMTHSPSNKYISLGETALAQSAGITLDKSALTPEGVRIVTRDKSIFLLGGGAYGTLYSVYDFMQLTFHFEQYFVDCMEIDTNVTEKKLYNYDVTDIPDMKYRSTGGEFMTQEFKNRIRMPLYSGNYLLPIHTSMTNVGTDAEPVWTVDVTETGEEKKRTAHNSANYLPSKVYGSEHPDWYGGAGDNVLCYTAHGNSEELDLMVEECTKKVEASLRSYNVSRFPNMNSVALTIMDEQDACSCEACTACYNRYGTNSASIILFMNKFSRSIRAMMEEHKNEPEFYREKFDILFFAYNAFALAPAHYDEAQGKYVANAPEMVLDDGVYVWLALRYILQEEFDIYHSKNDRAREQIEKWSALSNGLSLWTYSTNFAEYLYFHDSFALFNAQGYRFMAEHNVTYYYQNAQSYQTGTQTGFHNLALYLQSKLAWNTSLNTQELVDKYMNAMYGEAAPVMKELYLSMRLHNRQYKEKIEYSTSVANAIYFPYNILKKWTDMCDSALAAIEPLKTSDNELYNSTKDHIEAEWVFPAYATLRLRSGYLTEDGLLDFKQRFKEVVLRLGMTRTREIESAGVLTDYVNSL